MTLYSVTKVVTTLKELDAIMKVNLDCFPDGGNLWDAHYMDERPTGGGDWIFIINKRAGKRRGYEIYPDYPPYDAFSDVVDHAKEFSGKWELMPYKMAVPMYFDDDDDKDTIEAAMLKLFGWSWECDGSIECDAIKALIASKDKVEEGAIEGAIVDK